MFRMFRQSPENKCDQLHWEKGLDLHRVKESLVSSAVDVAVNCSTSHTTEHLPRLKLLATGERQFLAHK